MEIGHTYSLKIARTVDFGMYLESELGDILLPQKYVPEGKKPGDTVEVFVHRDSEDRILATTLKPAGEVGDFAALEVVDLNPHGAFLNWGLEKDLFVPKSEQHRPFMTGDRQVVMILLDRQTDRIMGTSKLNSFLKKDPGELQPGQEVMALIYEQTPLGYKAIIDGNREGLLYASEVFEDLSIGARITVTISRIREDGKIDLKRHPEGAEAIDRHAEVLLQVLHRQNGFLPLNDKSDPVEIRRHLKMSKKAFKKALGGLYRQRLVRIEEEGIRLNKA